RVEEARARLAASKSQAAPLHPPQRTGFDPLDDSRASSLPTGAEAVNILGAARDARPVVSTRPLVAESNDQTPSSQHLSALPQTHALLADRFAVRLSACFTEVSEGLNALDRNKEVISVWDSQVGTASYKEKEAHARRLSVEDARTLLCEEMQKTEYLEKKVGGLSKRYEELEKRLYNAEIFAKKVFDVYYPRAHDEVAVLVTEVRAKEVELLARVEKAEGERRSLLDQLKEVQEQLRSAEKREEIVKKELEEARAVCISAAGKQQKAAAAAETAKGENARLDQQIRQLQSQLDEMKEREREARVETARHAESARDARLTEEKKVAEITREANRVVAENVKKANAEMDKLRAETSAEYKKLQLQASQYEKEMRRQEEMAERYADRARRSEAKVQEWQEKFEHRIKEKCAEMQREIACSYRTMMSNTAPERHFPSRQPTSNGDEENLPAYAQFLSSRRRDPSPRPDPARPPSRGPPMAPLDDNRKRQQLRDAITTRLPAPRK
ncbi:hypothetical protein PMAYCL1PPCAC_28602, partial [Pristionchus mayeri]